MFKYSLDNKRYHTLNYYFKNKYGKKTFKVSLNANFSCPNKVNGSGCIYCSPSGSGDFAGNVLDDLVTQFQKGKEMMEKKWPNSYYIGYFQANTNTFAPLDTLKSYYEEIIKIDNVVGLNISTRSDSISDDTLEYLSDLNQRTNLIVELGLQSMHNKTLKFIKRGHDLKSFEEMVYKLNKRNINVVVHIINGLPTDTKSDMIETAKYLNTLPINGVKIHMLHVIKNTELGDMYLKEPFSILTKDEYIDIVCDQLEVLNEDIVIHRITGDPVKEDLIAPDWLLKKFVLLNDIDKELVRRNSWQGKKTLN